MTAKSAILERGYWSLCGGTSTFSPITMGTPSNVQSRLAGHM